MAILNVNGTTLEYVEQGSGEPVVLVHGSASDYRTWNCQIGAFGRRFTTIAYSRRYHWPNQRIPAESDYSMREHVQDLRVLLRTLHRKPCHLVGHSFGGFVCLLLANLESGLVRTLVLAEPPVVTLFVANSPKPAEILRLMLSRPRTAVSIMRFGANGVGPATRAARRGDMETAMRVFGRAVLGPKHYSALPPSRMDQVRANAIRAEFTGSGFPSVPDEAVGRIQVPVLLVNGEDSPRLFHRLTDRLEELLPRARRIEIPGASHIMHEDNAAAYNSAALSFLAEHGATRHDGGDRGC